MNTQKLRESCPNIRILRKSISYFRKIQLLSGTMKDIEIKAAEDSIESKRRIVMNYTKQHSTVIKKWNEEIDRLSDEAPCFAGGGYCLI